MLVLVLRLILTDEKMLMMILRSFDKIPPSDRRLMIGDRGV